VLLMTDLQITQSLLVCNLQPEKHGESDSSSDSALEFGSKEEEEEADSSSDLALKGGWKEKADSSSNSALESDSKELWRNRQFSIPLSKTLTLKRRKYGMTSRVKYITYKTHANSNVIRNTTIMNNAANSLYRRVTRWPVSRKRNKDASINPNQSTPRILN
jgi:hypothetical protein